MTKSNRSVAQRVTLNVEVEADRHRRYHVWEKTSTVHRYGRGATSCCAPAQCVLRGFVSETE
eukprot:4728145-Pleurochrysis_carterae.AAC.1